MSYDTHTSDSSRLPIDTGRFGFSHLLTLTVVLVAGTIILGVAARTTGSGLACDANWPVCDGGFLNLLPQGQPSFWEWIHRVVAMLAGFAIIGSAIAAIRSANVDNRIAGLVTAGMILTPIQVYLGRETVLSYELTILNFHFWTAILIFILFVVALVLTWQAQLGTKHVSLALGLAAVTVPVQVLLSPLFIQQNTPVTLSIQNGVILTLIGAVILAVMVGRTQFDDPKHRIGLLGTVVFTALVVILSREAVMTVSVVLDALYVGVAGALFVLLCVGVWVTRDSDSSRREILSS